MLKDKDLDNYYNEIFNTCTSKGFGHMKEVADKLKSDYSDISKIKNEQELQFRKGQLDILNWFLNFKEVYEFAYEKLSEEEQSD